MFSLSPYCERSRIIGRIQIACALDTVHGPPLSRMHSALIGKLSCHNIEVSFICHRANTCVWRFGFLHSHLGLRSDHPAHEERYHPAASSCHRRQAEMHQRPPLLPARLVSLSALVYRGRNQGVFLGVAEPPWFRCQLLACCCRVQPVSDGR